MMRSEAALSTDLIDRSVGRALACLRNNFRTTPDGKAGWYHYLDDPSPGVTASAVGLYCFHLAGERFERTDEVIRYLLNQQVKDDGDSRGGWSVRTTNGIPIVEATAWVVRSLSAANVVSVQCHAALAAGSAWLERNQNTDFGWGSYKGQPSRVFTTALAMLALAECGGSQDAIGNAQKWLNETQSPNQPAWGPLPASEPTILHTSVALMALLRVRGALSASALKQSVDWLLAQMNVGDLVEKSTSVEEYDVPYLHSGQPDTFQNSLPHFAGPVGLLALLTSGADPLQSEIFDMTMAIIDKQRVNDPKCTGTWELPRSPLRPSIWAVWPFVASLMAVRRSVFPWADRGMQIASTAMLLYPGCMIIQTSPAARQLTRRLLIQNAIFDSVRRHKFAVALWSIALALAAIPFALWEAGQLTLQVVLAAMAVPVFLVIFQMLWERRAQRRSARNEKR